MVTRQGRFFDVVEATTGIVVVDEQARLGTRFPTIRQNVSHQVIGVVHLVGGRIYIKDLNGRIVSSIVELAGFPVKTHAS